MRAVASALAAVIFPAHASAGPCEFVTTCLNLDRQTFPPCSPVEAAEAALVAPALQACEDIAYFFTKGDPWPNNDKAFYCNVNSPCGSLVPYLTNVRSYADVCDKFKPYYGVMQTFHGYCRDQPVAQLPGDNGLLASLKIAAGNQGSRPTPAPSRPANVETPEPIPNSVMPVPTPASTSLTSKTIDTPSPTTAKPGADNNADANSKTASAASSLASVGGAAAVVSLVATGLVHAALTA